MSRTRDDEEPLDELDQLVLDVLERMDADDAGALERACAEHPACADGLRQRIDALRAAGVLEEPRAAFPARLGEFRLLEHLGGGGMGVVYLARQESLGRDVALKLIRPDLLFFPDARRRFRREVETVARLSHPSIVPVYTVGEEQGVPYFAMERVRGATLAEVLAELAGTDPARLRARDLGLALERALARRGLPGPADLPLFHGTWVEACLRVVESVALALEHAHGEGVLHRDLKPSNALLAADGRALLFDFGLSASEGAAELTRSGAQVGSLPYMAPEQVRGERVDRRTDVYGLGATLYELLALRPPFAPGGAEALRAAILSGGAPPPSAHNAVVPHDLDLVCARALDPDPERRYPSAAELARDLRNVRELRPVRARPAGPLLRLRRWTQRHPARALSLALFAALALGTPTALAVQRGRSRARVQAALEVAREESARAEANLDRALEAVAGLLTEVGGSILIDVPGMTEARARLFERSRTLLADLAPQRPGDPSLSAQRARILTEGALVIDDLGDGAQAEAALREAEELLRAAAAAAPQRRDLRHALARTLASRGSQAIDRFRFEEGEAPLLQALGLWEALLAEDPGDREALAALRQAQANVASLRLGQERWADGLRHAEMARELAERLVALEDTPDARFALADSWILIGRTHGEFGRAESALRQGLALLDGLLAGGERERWLEQRAGAAVELAARLEGQGRYEEAARVAREALAPAERLASAYPAVLDHLRHLASLQERLGISLAWSGDAAGALEWVRRAVRTFEPVARAASPSVWLRLDRAVTLHNLATTALEAGLLDEAGPASAEAALELEALHAELPDNPQVAARSVVARLVHAQIGAEQGALPDCDALEALVRERAPEDAQVRFVLALTLAVSARAAGAGLDGSPGPPRAERFVERSFETLLEAFRLGYRSPNSLQDIRELAVLRARPEYELVLAEAAR